MIQTLNEMKAVLNLVLDNKEMNQVHEIVEGKETVWHSKDSREPSQWAIWRDYY